MTPFQKYAKRDFEQLQESFFDEVAIKEVEQDIAAMKPAMMHEFNTFIEFLELPVGSRICEVGCGTGRYTIPLLSLGYEVTAVDISEKSLNVLCEEAKKLGLQEKLCSIKSDFSRNIAKSEFDAAIAVNLLHHLENREIQFSNMVKSVKHNGALLIVEPNPLNPFFYPYYFLTRRWHLEKGFLYSKEEDLVSLFSKFELLDVSIMRYALIPTRVGNRLPFVSVINSFLEKNSLLGKFSLFTVIKGYKQDSGQCDNG